MRKTKIVCTLGPASADEKVMEAMLRAGMNVARFNFSHGTHESHREMMQRFRDSNDNEIHNNINDEGFADPVDGSEESADKDCVKQPE